MHSSKRDRRSFPKGPKRLRQCSRRRSKEPCFVSGSKRTIVSPVFASAGTELLTMAFKTSNVSYFLSPGAPRLMCFVGNFVDQVMR
jgi:hypothetical protein